MDRQWLLTRLEQYLPEDAADATRCEQMACFVRQHPDWARRSLSHGHVVASAWVVSPDHRQVLLHHHKKLDRWLQFGGHIETGDGAGGHDATSMDAPVVDATVLDAARRELTEESGLSAASLLSEAIFDLDIHPIPATPREGPHLHLDVRFLFAADPARMPAAPSETRPMRWFPLDAVATVTVEESLLRMVRKTHFRATAQRAAEA
ncbi:MAG: NUDIX hydrolase [Nitrospirota bacterium]|nr:NUDIX hydrolase [Nitrospirota bacterium]